MKCLHRVSAPLLREKGIKGSRGETSVGGGGRGADGAAAAALRPRRRRPTARDRPRSSATWASGQVHHPRTRVPVPRPRGVAVVTGEAHGGRVGQETRVGHRAVEAAPAVEPGRVESAGPWRAGALPAVDPLEHSRVNSPTADDRIVGRVAWCGPHSAAGARSRPLPQTTRRRTGRDMTCRPTTGRRRPSTPTLMPGRVRGRPGVAASERGPGGGGADGAGVDAAGSAAR